MILSAWLFVGTVAVLASGVALATAKNEIAIMSGIVGFITWGVWTFGALNLEIVRDATVYTFSVPEVAILGVALALIPAYIAFTGPVEMVGKARAPRQDEV